MTLLFFQNCISPHQIPYIKECIKDKRIEKVFLIIPRKNYTERENIGWNSDSLLDNTGIVCLFKPAAEEVSDLLVSYPDSYCFFSGIRADKDVFEWFRLSCKAKVKRYIITEPPFTYDKPLWMHYIRFYMMDYKYVKYIDGVFAIGEDAVRFYGNISKSWNVFPFQYVTRHFERTEYTPQGDLRILFVGNLCKRKNVIILLDALKGIENYDLGIVGDGDERKNLESFAAKNNINAKFSGARSIKEVPLIMQQYDVLVLPSLYDGWGAVVNEALDLGLYVVVSDKCGAKALITDSLRGLIFKNNDAKDLKQKLLHCISEKEEIRSNTLKRVQGSENIQGNFVAKYFIGCLLK